jgi:hypothetical protein
MHWETHIHVPLGARLEHRPIGVELVVVTEEIGLRVDEGACLADPLEAPGLLAGDTVAGAHRPDRIHDGLQRSRP